MIKLAQSEPDISIVPDSLDTDPWLLNVLNGTLDLRTGKLRAHERDDLITKQTPVEYDSQAQSPQWESFLYQIMAGNKALMGYVQRAVGYALTGSTREQVLFMLYGTGANGKSTFLEMIQTLLGV